jgi:DNA-binding transcriptional regulator GbsR (MarR family)
MTVKNKRVEQMITELVTEEKIFIEHAGIVFEQTGLPRMAGRIFGCLLIADPPYQSSEQLADALVASKGSVSTTTRLLMQIGLIERLGMPGERHAHFRIRNDAWKHLVRHGLEEEIILFRQLAETGLQSLTSKSVDSQKLLNEMYEIYSFLDKQFPLLIARWEQERGKEKPE